MRSRQQTQVLRDNLLQWFAGTSLRTKLLQAVVATLLLILLASHGDTVLQFAKANTLPYCELEKEPVVNGPRPSPYARKSWKPINKIDFVSVTAFPDNLRSSVASVCQFYDTANGLSTWHLIVPDRMVKYFSSHLDLLQCKGQNLGSTSSSERPPMKFKVWPESELIPAFTEDAPYGGTLRQMMLKLAAAWVVTSPYYLVLDSDVYARKPFNISDLLAPGLQPGSKKAVPRVRAVSNFDHPRWLQPPSWHAEASRALQTSLFKDTWEHCQRVRSQPPSGRRLTLASRPYQLTRDPVSGRTVYDACIGDKPLATHVTPMLLSAEIIRQVLAPRLVQSGRCSGMQPGGLSGGLSFLFFVLRLSLAASVAAGLPIARSRPMRAPPAGMTCCCTTTRARPNGVVRACVAAASTPGRSTPSISWPRSMPVQWTTSTAFWGLRLTSAPVGA